MSRIARHDLLEDLARRPGIAEKYLTPFSTTCPFTLIEVI
jgi:hypothetical protein